MVNLEAKIDIKSGLTKEDVMKIAKEDHHKAREYLAKRDILKTIYI